VSNCHENCDRGHAAKTRAVYDTTEALPHALLFQAEQVGNGWRQPLNNPHWVDTHDHLRADDPVLGLYLNRRARALPWWIMKNHHVANLAFDDVPVLVTLCEMCSGAAAFRAEAKGRRLEFRLRGTYNATILMDDTATGSLWSPFSGIALAGPMQGAALERLPLWQCLWSEWRALHPTTQVLHGEQTLREGHGSEFSPGSPGIGPTFRASLVRAIDERLPHNTLVLGVVNRLTARAYPLQTLAHIGPVLHDVLGGTEIVVRCRPGTLQALAFLRRVGERVLVFRCSAAGEVHDDQTGSVWNEMGEAVSGPLAGTQLSYINSGIEEWYAFAAYHPDAEIFEVR
jgi:uncharacterized protein DUF3179